MDDRIITGEILDTDSDDTNIRPQSLEEYVGQTDVKGNINIFKKMSFLLMKKCIIKYGSRKKTMTLPKDYNDFLREINLCFNINKNFNIT